MNRLVGGMLAFVLSSGAALPALAQQYDNQDRDWQPAAGWDRDFDVRCASQGYEYNMCQSVF